MNLISGPVAVGFARGLNANLPRRWLLLAAALAGAL